MSKLIISLVTIAGLLPVGFLSIQSLISHASFSRIHEQSSDPGSVSIMGNASIEMGPSFTKLRLSTQPWPALITLTGIAFVFVGMFFLLPGKPQQFYYDGLSRIGYYIERVIESKNDYASVLITKPDGAHSTLISRRGRHVSLNVVSSLSMGGTPDFQTKILDFFANQGITPISEALSSNSGIKDNICHLQFALSIDPKTNTKLIRALFINLFGVDDSMGLEFTTTGF